MIHKLLLLLFPLFVTVNCQFTVTAGPNVTLTTYVSNVSVVSSEPSEMFEKRIVNSSHPVSVSCGLKLTSESKDKIEVVWLKQDKELTMADKGQGNKIMEVVTVTHDQNVTSTLTVKIPTEDHATYYVCKFSIGSSSVNATVNILSPPIIANFTKAKRAIQGDKLKIACGVKGFPLPESVTWLFGNQSSELVIKEGMSVEASDNGVKNAILRFTNLKFDDRGIYWCQASNSLGEDTAGVLVRAKNRLDALWPFLGIVAEVAILVTLILLYERKRSTDKRPAEVNGVAGEHGKEDEEEAEPTAETKAEAEKDEDVRQRPVKV